jgi:CRISPR/Cas system CSM-associated protein Csm3 (group 7 of RAMP superfamily)
MEEKRMQEIKYKITLETLTDINISSGSEEGGFIDSYLVKDHQGKFYIPGSTFKGKVRDNLYMITNYPHKDNNCDCAICQIFGSEGYKRSKIFFDNMYGKTQNSSIRYGTSVDRYRGVVKDGALFNYEVASVGTYSGYCTVYIKENQKQIKEDLELAIKMIESIGAGKSRGLGKVKITITEVKE